MLSRLIPLGVLCAAIGLASPLSAFAAPRTALLTLEDALARTFRQAPELIAAAEDRQTAAAEASRAGRLPNPELSVSLENVAGSGDYTGSSAAELTIAVGQPLELGDKRRLRRETAQLQRQLADCNEELAHAAIAAETRRRFVAVLAAQQGLSLAGEQAELAANSLAAAEERIATGKAPALDRLRLQGDAAQAELAVTRAEHALSIARQALATGWGETTPDFDRVAGDLGVLPAVPLLADAESAAEQAAAARQRHITTSLFGKELEQARAERIPDPNLTAGWRQFRDNADQAWLFGISVPLPLFNRGDEAVAAAGSRFNSAKARASGARNEARVALHAAWQALKDTRDAAELLDRRIVPAAEEGFAAAEFGYRLGKFGLLELLDAQRTLFAVKEQQLAARTACHLAAIELQRLQGTSAPRATP